MGPTGSANPNTLGNLRLKLIHHISRYLNEFDVYRLARVNRYVYGYLEGEWFYDHVGPNAASPALLAAAEHGHLATVKRALEGGADINYQDSLTGETALVAACDDGNEAVVQYLLQQSGIEVNASEGHGWTGLHLAALLGFESIVSQLLTMPNLEVNLTDVWKATPLALAAHKGHLTVVTLLLDFAADVDVPCDNQGDDRSSAELSGHPALFWATISGHVETVSLLQTHGAALSARSSNILQREMDVRRLE
ncbi:hypothetical protein FSARC_9108 [Fusarium sarcochroum]|uniref:Ankyrin repeat protein n=1 Tax=Fusarium sarcochroum TaxID=1208366 RepID=A0A8H4X685_9HYPO|nr:hypothetical protein FSARC_9108 [Fusarium sarcochroum]